jgi:hypothetical protein
MKPGCRDGRVTRHRQDLVIFGSARKARPRPSRGNCGHLAQPRSRRRLAGPWSVRLPYLSLLPARPGCGHRRFGGQRYKPSVLVLLRDGCSGARHDLTRWDPRQQPGGHRRLQFLSDRSDVAFVALNFQDKFAVVYPDGRTRIVLDCFQRSRLTDQHRDQRNPDLHHELWARRTERRVTAGREDQHQRPVRRRGFVNAPHPHLAAINEPDTPLAPVDHRDGTGLKGTFGDPLATRLTAWHGA